jgi:hypothetical protein
MTLIGSSVPLCDSSDGVVAMDDHNEILYAVSKNRISGIDDMAKVGTDPTYQIYLVGFNLNNGELTAKIQLPFVSTPFFGLGQVAAVDPATGDVFVCGPLDQTLRDSSCIRLVIVWLEILYCRSTTEP